MKRKKRDRLEMAGWKVGTAEKFLGLTAEEARYVELKLALSEAVRHQRSRAGLPRKS